VNWSAQSNLFSFGLVGFAFELLKGHIPYPVFVSVHIHDQESIKNYQTPLIAEFRGRHEGVAGPFASFSN
jgi:hypothetical protein